MTSMHGDKGDATFTPISQVEEALNVFVATH
jgi:hypothetical protein